MFIFEILILLLKYSDLTTLFFVFPLMQVVGKGTASFGKRHNKTHITCRRCGKRSFHLQKGICSACGYPSARLRKCEFVRSLLPANTLLMAFPMFRRQLGHQGPTPQDHWNWTMQIPQDPPTQIQGMHSPSVSIPWPEAPRWFGRRANDVVRSPSENYLWQYLRSPP